MTVQNNLNKHIYIGDGEITEFPYTFILHDEAHMKVYVVDLEGNETLLEGNYEVDMYHYKVIYPLSGDPLPPGHKLILYREVPVTQEMDLTNQGALPNETLERAYDKLTLIAQQHDEAIKRSLKASLAHPGGVFDWPVPAPGKAVGWNEDGTGMTNYDNPSEASAKARAAADRAEEAADRAEKGITHLGLKIGLDIHYYGPDDLRVVPGQIHINAGNNDFLVKKNTEFNLSSLIDLSTISGWKYVCVKNDETISLETATGSATDRPTDSFFQWSGYNHQKQGYYFDDTKRILGAIYRVNATTWYIINCLEGGAESGENARGRWIRDKDGNQEAFMSSTPIQLGSEPSPSAPFYYNCTRWIYPVPFIETPTVTPVAIDNTHGVYFAVIGNCIVENNNFVYSQTGVDIELFGSISESVVSVIATAKGRYRNYYVSPADYWSGIPLKGQLHCHSTNSDGVDTPVELVTAYKAAGYDFIAITDHDYITSDPGVEGIIFIPGIEETANVPDTSHLTSYDITDQVIDKTVSVQDIVSYHANKGRIVSIAHPELQSPEIDTPISVLLATTGYEFLEVWNALQPGQESGETSWDAVLSAGKRIYGIAVDDTHNFVNNGDRAWVVVYVNNTSKADILQALKDGNFYATTGNDIGIKRVDNTIYAVSSFISNFQFIGRDGIIVKEATMTKQATFDLVGNETYIRVKAIRASDGKIAWAQPVFIV